MPDFSKWGLSPDDVSGNQPTQSVSEPDFNTKWLGPDQTVIEAPPASKPLTLEAVKSVFTDPAKRAQLAQTPIGRLVTAIGSGLTYPGDVIAGKATVPQSKNLGEEDTSGINRVADLASVIPMGAGIPGVYGAGKALIDPATASLANLARNKFEIPIRGSQISESPTMNYLDSVLKGKPFSGMGANTAEQHAAFNRSVARTIGEDAEKVTPEVMADARERLGHNYDDIAAATTLKFDQPLISKLSDISDKTKFLQKDEVGVINRHVNHIIDIAAKNGQEISGKDYKELITTGSPLDLATKSSNSNISHYAGEIKDALIDALDRHAPEDMKSLLKTTNAQYKAMKTIEPLVAKSPTGDLSPALLMGRVNQKYSTAYGGGGDLAELSRIGQRFLKEPPQSGTAPRLSISNLLGGAGVGAGELAALYFHDPIMGAKVAGLGLVGLGGKAAINKGLGSLLTSDRYANRLISSASPGNAVSNPHFLQKLVNSNIPYLPYNLPGMTPQLVGAPQYQP